MTDTIPFKHSSNVTILKRNDPYKGNMGIVTSYIPSKYKVEIDVKNAKRELLINKTWVRKYADDVVKVTKGDYTNSRGRIINRYDAEVIVNITTTGKNYTYKQTEVFFKDLLLTNNDYMQIKEIYLDRGIRISGYEMRNNRIVDSTIDGSSILKVMPGLELYTTLTTNIPDILKPFVKNIEDQGEEVQLEEVIYDNFDEEEENVNDNDNENENEREITNYADLGLDDDGTDEDQVTVSYADVERSSYMTRELTDDEREYERYIRQLGFLVIDDVNKYDIFDKAASIMKNIVKPGYEINATNEGETAVEKYNRLKSMNLKFIIACLVFYDLNKTRHISYNNFFRSIPEGYFNMNENINTIMENIFLMRNVPRLIELTEEQQETIRDLYRRRDNGGLIQYSLHRCDENLRMILNITISNIENIQLQSVKKSEKMDIDKDVSQDRRNKNRMNELKSMIERGLDNDGEYERELFNLEMSEYLNQDRPTLIEKIQTFKDTLNRRGDSTGKLKRKINMITKAVFVIDYKKKLMDEISNVNSDNTNRRDILQYVYDNLEKAESVLSSMHINNIIDRRIQALAAVHARLLRQYEGYLAKKEEEEVLASKLSKMAI
uniref:Uncharacterized protein n=1 Tax=viral metagenome TaxID=1070528 RepID=A0A6C0DW83_9ZZZZ